MIGPSLGAWSSSDAGMRRARPGDAGQGGAARGLAVFGNGDGGEGDLHAWPGEESTAGWGAGAVDDAGADPFEVLPGSTRGPVRGPVAPPRRWARTGCATARPSSAATSAVSTGCGRLPMANTPGRLVRRAVSTSGPSVPRSMSSPAARASSWSGIQSPVSTTVSQATSSRLRCRGARVSTARTRGLPMMRHAAGAVCTGRRNASAAEGGERPVGLGAACTVVMSDVGQPASRRVSTAD